MADFATPPAPSSGVKWRDLYGALLAVDVLGVEPDIQTQFGPSDAVRATITVIDGEGDAAGDVYNDALVFPRVLRSQLEAAVGQTVLGRLGQGTAKPGQSAPWILNDPTADDVAKAEEFFAASGSPV